LGQVVAQATIEFHAIVHLAGDNAEAIVHRASQWRLRTGLRRRIRSRPEHRNRVPLIARITVKRLRGYSRPGNELTHRFPLIVEPLSRIARTILHSELGPGGNRAFRERAGSHTAFIRKTCVVGERLV
jgi:hypothetical protein